MDKLSVQFSSVQSSCSVVSDSLQPHELQQARATCPSPSPGVHSNSCPSSQWCHPAISSSVAPFFSCPQSLPASGISYIVSKNTTRSWLCLRSLTPYCQIQINFKKVGKTTRPFRYDINQTAYNYTVEVTNRFKGLDLIDRVPKELWMEIRDIVQEAVIKTIPKKKRCKKAKWLS